MAEAGDFNLIVTAVESGKVPDAGKRFAQAFGLDETIATQICKSAPIIFAQKLTKAEVKAITPVLTELSSVGMEFRVTARIAAKLPKVNWPVRPQFTAGGVSGASGLAFEWDNNAFVCPGCGETFLFRRLGKLQLAEAPAEAPANGSEMARSRTSRAAVPAYADHQPIVEGVEGLSRGAGEGESFDLPEALDVPPPASAPAGELEDLLPEPEEAPVGEPESIPLDDLPAAPEGGEFSAAAEEPLPEPELAPEPEPAAEPEAPVEEEAPVEQGELYNVFLSKITDTSKRDKAAELIAKIKGCSPSEAKELTTRLVIPLAKNVGKGKAEDILNQFKKLKIFGRMTKVK